MKNIENTSQKQYGTLSMVAIIVGMVIGSGIFIKNQSLMEGTHSVILTTIGWIIGGLVVLSMMLAFIEISSITKLKGEQGTFKNWSRHLFNEKTSRYIGTYFSFVYFPLVLGAETIFASQKFMEIGGMDSSLINSDSHFWLWFSITFLSFFIISAAFITNSFWIKPGKTINSAGSIIKLIPLFVVIAAGALAIFGIGAVEPNNIFDVNDPVNSGLLESSSGENITHILMILPGILFAFDGFLYANSMSNETKTPETFKRAVIISVIFITLTYILFSVMSMTLAQQDTEGNFLYGIGDILYSIFPGAEVIGDILIFLIFLSITSATFGYSLTTMWSLADYSDTNNIVDSEGKLVRRNKVGNPSGAGMRMLIYSLSAIAIMRGFDLVTLYILSTSGELGIASQSTTLMTDYTSDLFTVFNFAFYSILIIGALSNRITNKNEVEKIKGFTFFAIFSSIMMIGIVGYMGYSILSSIVVPLFGIDTGAISDDIIISSSKLALFIVFVSSFIIITLILNWQIKRTPAEIWGYKRIFRKAYELHVPYKEYKDKIPASAKVDFSPAYKKLEEISGKKINKSQLVIEFNNSIDVEKISKNENMSIEELQDKLDKYYNDVIEKSNWR